MCGIAGIINLQGKDVKESDLNEMIKEMKHRGPDDDGMFLDKNIGLGFVRLSILDLSSAGHQPMHSENKRYVVVFNGEVFNFVELKTELENKGYKFHTNTDTEVLLNSYKEWGEECQHKFNGMWAFAIYDRYKKLLAQLPYPLTERIILEQKGKYFNILNPLLLALGFPLFLLGGVRL